MSIRNILKYIFILIFSAGLAACPMPVLAQSNTDTAAAADTVQPKVKYVEKAGRQLCFNYDITRPIINASISDRRSQELAIDYYLKKEFYLEFEGGWGGSNVTYSDLAYTTRNGFFRAGFNKSIFKRTANKDWDMGFVGLRYAMAFIQRSAASYMVTDSTWGNTSGAVGNSNNVAYWIELVGGMRVELLKNFFAGWTVRGKIFLDPAAFTNLAPLYIAGYGRGDKNTAFDFNLYLSYSIRWNRKLAKEAAAILSPSKE